MRNFTKRISYSDDGIKLYGNPKSLDHIYGSRSSPQTCWESSRQAPTL